ncbi:uncharacterized protein LOC142241739 [Haematobia irritans]|uniref:uncharacterized protein LOC142241739 n=1 Tax=Haematobia irritans TaxID=7368 RepID=UPI003F501F2B
MDMDYNRKKEICQLKYNIRKQKSSNTSNSSSSVSISLASGVKCAETIDDLLIKIESDSSTTDTDMFASFSGENSQSGEIILDAPVTAQDESSSIASPSTSAGAAGATTSSSSAALNKTALIALQQLASISSTHSIERLLPQLPKDLLAQNETLVYAGRPGKRLPRQSSKRLSQFETNRCPLCSRVYRSQAFLNEHMRKEHSVLI